MNKINQTKIIVKLKFSINNEFFRIANFISKIHLISKNYYAQ